MDGIVDAPQEEVPHRPHTPSFKPPQEHHQANAQQDAKDIHENNPPEQSVAGVSDTCDHTADEKP
jgi:hypothetical protein